MRLFEWQEPRQKHRLLDFVLSNCTWTDDEMLVTFRQLFDFIAKATTKSIHQEAVDAVGSRLLESWLGSYRPNLGNFRNRR